MGSEMCIRDRTSTHPISKQPSRPSPSEPASAPAKRRADESLQSQEATRRKVSSLESDNTTEADYKEKLALLYPRIDSEVRNSIGFDQFSNRYHSQETREQYESELSELRPIFDSMLATVTGIHDAFKVLC